MSMWWCKQYPNLPSRTHFLRSEKCSFLQISSKVRQLDMYTVTQINLSTVCAHCTSYRNQHALMLFNGNRFPDKYC